MSARSRLAHATSVIALAVLLTGCGDGGDGAQSSGAGDGERAEPTGETGQTASPADVGDGQRAEGDEAGEDDVGEGGAWFSIDEGAGTVTVETRGQPDRGEALTVPIVADATWTIGERVFEFAVFTVGYDACPVPDSGSPDDIIGFRGVGHGPDGQPVNVNANSPQLAVNTTYEADWRSTTTAHDLFSPDWVVSGDGMEAESESITVVATGEQVSGRLTVTCR